MNQYSHSSESMSSLFSAEYAQSNLIYSTQVKESEPYVWDIEITIPDYISMNDFFMIKAKKVVENNLDNTEFTLETFAREMKISVSTLARRFREQNLMTPNRFIINIRMKHAKQLLINKYGTVRKIAQNVGFEDCKYFSRCFKAQFGVTPNEIRKHLK
jgi:AraC-like DNA-binding protein